MATLLLSTAGSAIGGAIGGSILGVGAATLGQAAGAIAGSVIDQKILGRGSRAVEVGRARSLRLQGSTEGAPVPVVYGRMRVAGQLIWSTRFLETVRTTTQGGKATSAPRQEVREFAYSISIAVGLCEGPIDRVGRIWADGKLLDTQNIVMRVHAGGPNQQPDPKIQAVEGAANVPAYRDLAYVVFEDLPLAPFGNRIPQLNFEVFRSVDDLALNVPAEERGRPLKKLIHGVALSPGTGEFALDPVRFQHVNAGGPNRYANVNNGSGRTDIKLALDQLDAELPDCRNVSLIVSWFGTDLRCGRCLVQPRVEEAGRQALPASWSVAGLTTATAPVVSRDAEGRPNFGGTPSDASVIRAIQELKARGKRVMLYPFLLMDVPEGNGLADPYGAGAEQPVFPWRGRITLDTAPGLAGSADQTPAAGAEVAQFFGTAAAGDFTVGAGTVGYSGPAEWGWRRFVLHLAALAAAAGGVDAFCVGSEMRGLTTIRSARTAFPAVDAFRTLAGEVRQLLPAAKLSYAADWSEYFGHQPQDGSGDVLFHLDPLWADPEIDFVGIDDYTPLSDWRHSTNHLDAIDGARSIYSLPYLRGNVEGGEQFDWFYASPADREAQARTPIADGAHGEDWVFRPKDIRGWWQNPHHNRIDGVREATPTGWVPESKPVWLTETGCPAVDLGANMPNLFFDGRSSESGLPPGSFGARDDEMQRRFLQAKLGYWDTPARNPVSVVYGGPMIDPEGLFVWTWDARPWPDFPTRQSVWSDGPSYRLGHWLTGRLSSGSLAEIVADICARSGLTEIDVGDLHGSVDGYLIDRTQTGRAALQPLMQVFGFEAVESGGKVVFRMRGIGRGGDLAEATMADPGAAAAGPVEIIRDSEGAAEDVVRLTYVDAGSDYRVSAVEARLPDGRTDRVAETSLQIGLGGAVAQAAAERWLVEAIRARERAEFALPPSQAALEPGDVFSLPDQGSAQSWRVERITDTGPRRVEAVRIEPTLYLPTAVRERAVEPERVAPPGPIAAVFLDLALPAAAGREHWPHLAVAADPWPGEVAVYRSADGETFTFVESLRKPAAMGTLLEPLAPAAPNRWQRAGVRVALPQGVVESRARLSVLNGANRLAIEAPGGAWELVQFRDAVLVAPGEYRLQTLLRGQRDTGQSATSLIPAGARVVLLDDAVVQIPLALDERGLARTYRVGPARLPVSDPAFVETLESFTGIGLRPFAPAHFRARRDPASGDIAIGWIRQTRIGGDSWESFDVPHGEDVERYRLSILAGGVVLREEILATPGFTYTAAQQAADGAAGPLDLRVAQFSTVAGFGSERETTFNG